MTRGAPVGAAGAAAAPSRVDRARDDLRLRRQRAVLDAGRHVIATDGYDALTMQRLAVDLECGIATIYRLFPSKDAVVL